MTKASEFRDQTVEELIASCEDARKALFQLVNQNKQTKKMDKPHLIRQKRKDIARLLTVITEKQSAQKA